MNYKYLYHVALIFFAFSCEDSKPKFISDFISAGVKVMNLDRFDLK